MARLDTKTAEEAHRTFEAALAKGHDHRRASQLAGVSERTGRRWQKQIRAESSPPIEVSPLLRPR